MVRTSHIGSISVGVGKEEEEVASKFLFVEVEAS